MDRDHFRVVIAGGGLAGLTLASALEQAGIDYVLLERRNEVAPQVGASIAIYPNGARILDQLGAWKKVDDESVVMKTFYMRGKKGKAIGKPHFSNLMVKSRFGYAMAWGERQILLQALYENFKDTSKILTDKNVIDIKHDADGVTAICADGSSFRGDIMVGADGVFSKTRSKLWELAEPEIPDLVDEEKRSLIAEYNCLFGIAKGLTDTQLISGDVDTSYNSGRCAVTIADKEGKVYWFAQERLSETYTMGNFPRYTTDDAEAFVARNGDLALRPSPNGLTLAEIWKKTVSSRLVPIEEGKFKLWHWGRIACVGDSVHKSTPNLGAGGNAAIETAATLANGIKRLADLGRRPTKQEIENMLAEYQKTREVRAAAVVDASGKLARLHNMDSPISYLFVHHALPRMSEFFPEMISNIVIGAPKLDFLPLPMASLTGAQPFNPTHGDGLRESKLKRMLFASPLLALMVGAVFVMDARPSLDWVRALQVGRQIELDTGSVPILRNFYQVQGFDHFIAFINSYFFPSMYGYDPASRRQTISFLTDGFVLLTIWILESARRANLMTPMQLPTVFALMAQVIGLGPVASLYCFLHYIFSPIENFSALDQRLTDLNRTSASLPALVLAYLIPFYFTVGIFYGPSQAFLFIWQLYPVWLAIGLWVGAKLFRDTSTTDKLRNTQRDLPVMRLYVGAGSVVSAAVWMWAWMTGGHGMGAVFVPGSLPHNLDSLVAFTSEFLKWDEVFGFGAHLIWLGYLFGDLARAGMLREGWLKVMGLGVLSLLAFGPGAALGMGWLFREHLLATRRHKDALTVESVERLHGVLA